MTMIWFKEYSIDDAMAMVKEKCILHTLGLECTEIGDDFVSFRMPVDHRTHQVHGILHGGATCVLAETAGSVASLLCIDPAHKYAVGSQIMANHLRPVKDGFVTATAKPVHIGRTKHVWDIPVVSDAGKLIAKCELTCAVTPKS